VDRTTRGQAIVFGIVLVLIGTIYLLLEFIPERLLEIDLARYGWPVFVMAPGLVLIAVGGAVEDASGLCLPGTVVLVAGFVLLVQNTFDLFATWSYAWALVAPASVGGGMWLQGLVVGDAGLRAAGARTMRIGFVVFLLAAVFFEGIVHVSGRNFGFIGRVLLPFLIIGIGVFLMVRRTRPAGR